MYKVIKYFTDLQDNDRIYNVGDVFPRNGLTVSADRLAELSSSNNKQGQPVIELVEEKVEAPKKATTKKAAAKNTEK